MGSSSTSKIGLTSRAVQKQLGVNRPDFGVLFADMMVAEDEVVAAGRVLQPKIEAEVAFLVQDRYQGRGIGTFLLQQLMRIARSKGVAGFTADVLADDRDMLDVLHRSGCDLRRSLAGGVYHLELRFPPESED